ncbi:Uncharacterised protein [Mycobacteroides abscessus subsp. abscessus]|nr:Uncharacterised protein [Mycobacteroides abscessus subsp. abscessus]SKW21003.1 Uncharacterised protein [Mycobacteroides abscessus subsp. abscessus]
MRRRSGVEPLMSCNTTMDGQGPSPSGFSRIASISPLGVGIRMSVMPAGLRDIIV